MRKERTSLLSAFAAIQLGMAALAAALHALLSFAQLAPTSFFFYLPLVAVLSISGYVFYLKKYVRDALFKGAGVVTVPTVYYMASLAGISAGLNGIAVYTDRVVVVNHISELSSTRATFIRLPNLTADLSQLRDTTVVESETDEDGATSNSFVFQAIAPAGENTFLSFREFKSFPGALDASVINSMRDDFTRESRAKALTFPIEQVQYVEVIPADRVAASLLRKEAAPVLLHASLETAAAHRHSWVKICLISLGILCVFFVGVVSFGDHEEIEHD